MTFTDSEIMDMKKRIYNLERNVSKLYKHILEEQWEKYEEENK